MFDYSGQRARVLGILVAAIGILAPVASEAACEFGDKDYGAGRKLMLYPRAPVKDVSQCRKASLTCKWVGSGRNRRLKWFEGDEQRRISRYSTDCTVEQPKAPVGAGAGSSGSGAGLGLVSGLLSSVEGSKQFTCRGTAGDPWKLVEDGGKAYCFRKAESFDYEKTKFDEKKLLSSCSGDGGQGMIEKIFYKTALRDDQGQPYCCEKLGDCDPDNESYQANVDSGICVQPEGGSCYQDVVQTVEVQVAEIHRREETVDTFNVTIEEVMPVDPGSQLAGLDTSCEREPGEEEIKDRYNHFLGVFEGTPAFEGREYVRAMRYTYRCRNLVACGGGATVPMVSKTTYEPGSRLYVMKFEAKMPSTCFDGHPFAYAPGVSSCWDSSGAPFTRKDREGRDQIIRDDIGSSTTTQRQLSDTPGNHPNFISSPSALSLRRDAENRDMWGVPNHWSRPGIRDQRRYIDAMAVPFIVYPSCYAPQATLREEILGDFVHVVTERAIATAVGGDANGASFTSQPEWSARLYELQGARQEQGCGFQSNNWGDTKHNFMYVFDDGKIARGRSNSKSDPEPDKTYQGNQSSLLVDLHSAQYRFQQKFSPRMLQLMAQKLLDFELDFKVGPTLFAKPPASLSPAPAAPKK